MADDAERVLHILAVEDDPTDQSWLLILLEQSTVCPYHISFAPTMNDAEGLYRRAIELDPGYADARAKLDEAKRG